MTDELVLEEESALNLQLQGSVGSFKVGSGLQGQNSLEVKFFLTHVGLDFSISRDEELLKHLAPVREIFNFENLDFDEIMQRDIDDARVSSELIPYLLDEKSKDLIKLFPPIVVVVLPVKETENKPANKYPRVTSMNNFDNPSANKKLFTVCSGEVGQEVFKFEQPILSTGKIVKHDKVRLHLNTNKCKLVIVDGQHRAMALLALYRNLKDDWSDAKRAPYKEFYSEWTPNYIQKYNLKEINLPLILCTFPSIDEDYNGDFDLKKAARMIFLTLNKNARKVSNSRNKLLDDKDLIAHFLRSCLSIIKKEDDRSSDSLRIFNVELDQDEDRVKIKSPIAITSVNHIYYIIEHLMLNNEDVNGSLPRSGKFYKRTNLETCFCMSRLNGRNILGAKDAENTTRDNFTAQSSDKLNKEFIDNYGNILLYFFKKFKPFEMHNRAVLNLETDLEKNNDRTLRPILFEGQGMNRVFENHRRNLKEKLDKGSFETEAPKIQEIAKRLDATAQRIEGSIEAFRKKRAEKFISNIGDKNKLKEGQEIYPKILTWINDLYDNILTTVAFQSGVLCGFFGELEKTNNILTKSNKQAISFSEEFENLISQLNDFFVPTTSAIFKKIVKIFSGDIDGDISNWKILKTNHTFRHVVYRGEMQPDQWPKYKYLILEIWHPINVDLKEAVVNERNKCRNQIFKSLYNSFREKYCQDQKKHEQDLTKDEIDNIFSSTYSAYHALIKNIGGEAIDKNNMKQVIEMSPTAQEETIDEDDEYWESINGEI